MNPKKPLGSEADRIKEQIEKTLKATFGDNIKVLGIKEVQDLGAPTPFDVKVETDTDAIPTDIEAGLRRHFHDSIEFDTDGWSFGLPTIGSILEVLRDEDIVRFSPDDEFGHAYGDVKDTFAGNYGFSIHHSSFERDGSCPNVNEVDDGPTLPDEVEDAEYRRHYFVDFNTKAVTFIGMCQGFNDAQQAADEVVPGQHGFITTMQGAETILKQIQDLDGQLNQMAVSKPTASYLN